MMTQPTTTPSVSGFFSGGGKTAKFPTIGTTVTGTITAVHPPEPQRDYTSGQEIPGKTQVRIELATELRDPEIEFDDGARTLYVKGWMTGAIGDALRKANAKEPQIGATLAVTYTGDGQPTRPGFNGPKQYSATYTAATSTTATYFGTGEPLPIPDEPPAGIDAKAWAAMPEDAKRAVLKSVADNPPF